MKPRRANNKPGAVKPPSQRQLRVGEEIRHILSQVFLRGVVHNDLLLKHSITVSEVQMSPDLKQARAFVMTLGGLELDATIAALNDNAPIIRSYIAKDLSMKFTPRVIFKPDLSFENADRIYRLLASAHVVQDLDKD